MANPEHFDLTLVIGKALKSGEYAEARAQSGDVFVGAKIVGADRDEALEVARIVHCSPVLRAQMATAGGLLIGAREYLEPTTTTGEVNG